MFTGFLCFIMLMYLAMGVVITLAFLWNHAEIPKEDILINYLAYVIAIVITLIGWLIFFIDHEGRMIMYSAFLSDEDYYKYYDEMFRIDERDL